MGTVTGRWVPLKINTFDPGEGADREALKRVNMTRFYDGPSQEVKAAG